MQFAAVFVIWYADGSSAILVTSKCESEEKNINVNMYKYIVILSVFAAACAQMLLKQGARKYAAPSESGVAYPLWRQYLNPWVIGGYAIMAGSMILNIFCMSRGVQVKEVSTIESLSYLFVPCLAFLLFDEKITWRKAGAIAIIITGVIIFFI